jgi:superoxide dismutase, Cu-Zn family
LEDERSGDVEMKGLWISGAAALALAGCASSKPAELEDVVAPPEALAADLRDASGQVRARTTAEQAGDSIRVRIEAVSMAQGAYGAHIHTTGRCDPPGFTTAGAHWNPTRVKHGKDNPQGMHKGDLPNLLVGTDGRGSFEYTIPNASISGGPNPVIDADGAAVVIHAAPDDFRTDPSGNSGARVACGVLG